MSSQTIAVVAEKPSVARDIARVLNAQKKGDGFLHGDGYVVTWAIGHLVALAQPAEIRAEWKFWRRETLPMIPGDWPLVVLDQTKGQFEVVRKILTSPKVGAVICATDAGREGELIFRYIYEAAGCDKPVQRLWISSLTPEAIRDGFAKLRDGHDYDPLGNAAKGRSRADWLVGMNLSRAYSLACNEELSVGRVQTPTLAMLVDRELAIRNFVPEDYINVVATFSPREGDQYDGTWFKPGVEPMDAAMKLPASGEEAKAVVERARTGAASIERMESQIKRMSPPLLYDLTELQRHGNRLYGFSAQRTLEIAQALYEKHKLISYPRTDSRHLSQDVARTLPKVVGAVAGEYRAMLAPGTGERPLGRRFVDDAKVSDHHAIIPTGVSPANSSMDADERRIFDLICRRLLSAWHEDYIWSVTTVITLIRGGGFDDRFHSSGTAVVQTGWKVLDIGGGKKDRGEDGAGEDGQTLPPDLAEGQTQRVLEVEAVAKKTRPPKRMTDATLLTAMETAGKTLDDKELSDAMKESGLGTPATRAQIIEVLLKRGFIERRGKSLEATEKGIRLIEIVHPEVKSPAMTGQWEAFLKRIEKGKADLPPFIQGIEEYVRDVVGKAWLADIPAVREPSRARSAGAGTAVATAPAKSRIPAESRTGTLDEVLRKCFGFEKFRPNQEEVCRAVVSGRDVLLVMPTGSGKSLCYQLPGVMLGGTTLVISPLIALMEDQAAKLNAMGFAAERIHSNRDRGASREASFAYLEGRLDFLFIAPERLRVRGFPEMLAKRPPALIAIDEAHCISQWGHDFRPDYRHIGQHLPGLRPAPVIALTATATPLVQHDIAEQLGLEHAQRMIHGFRRDNIAIEVVEVDQNARFELAEEILTPEGRRPAIVYTPRRRDAEKLARRLQESLPAAAYHAGLDGRRRDEVQTAFLDGKLDVIVATIAFGMGIDKPDVRTVIHTALPGSVEGYYQEIGRAGRDGAPSRAILMHSYGDRYTHDYFFERDYPDPKVLEHIRRLLTPEPQSKEDVLAVSKLAPDTFDTALEKLWTHGGAMVDYADNITAGGDDWRDSYLQQREHKVAQFEKMLAYCETSACRMTSLVRYFGDFANTRDRCGVCDFCDPSAGVALTWRAPNEEEQGHITRILEALAETDGVGTGRVFQQCFGDGSLDRRRFEELLRAMARSGLVEIADASFEKDGKRIDFHRVRLTRRGREPEAAEMVLVPEAIATEGGDAERRPARKKATKKKAKAAKSKSKKKTDGAEPAAKRVAPQPANAAAIATLLKSWRTAEAKRMGAPPFVIMNDKVLQAIAQGQPRSEGELLEISGVGRKFIEKYGEQVFRIVSSVR
ncbi:MAG: DNA topoisomerase 3 [Acidobacteria bacterium]|nr:DNA topoisomerase 3 [Acidobacteriota bacterium]